MSGRTKPALRVHHTWMVSVVKINEEFDAHLSLKIERRSAELK